MFTFSSVIQDVPGWLAESLNRTEKLTSEIETLKLRLDKLGTPVPDVIPDVIPDMTEKPVRLSMKVRLITRLIDTLRSYI